MYSTGAELEGQRVSKTLTASSASRFVALDRGEWNPATDWMQTVLPRLVIFSPPLVQPVTSFGRVWTWLEYDCFEPLSTFRVEPEGQTPYLGLVPNGAGKDCNYARKPYLKGLYGPRQG
jgi:hypothetical protein